MPEDIDEVLRNIGGNPIENLRAKMERAIRNRQGTRFSPSDIDWLTMIGGYAMLLQAVADEAFEESAARLTEQGFDVSRFPRPTIQTFKGKPDTAIDGDDQPDKPAVPPLVRSNRKAKRQP